MPDQWAFLVEAFNDVEAEIICGLLQSAEIPYRKEDSDSLSGAMRIFGGQAYQIRITVPEAMLKKAQMLLRSTGAEESGEPG